MNDTERQPSRGWPVFVGLLLILLILLCTCRDSSLIQADLWDKGRTALERKNYDSSLLSFSGRDALLSGEVASGAIRDDMEQTIRAIRGVRQAGFRNELSIVSSQQPTLDVQVDPVGITLAGLVSAASRTQLVTAAADLYGSDNVADNLQVASNIAEPDWLSGVLALLPQLRRDVVTGRLQASTEQLSLEGEVASDEIRSELGSAADLATKLEVLNRITVAAALPLRAASLNVRLGKGQATLDGLVPEESLAAALDAASQAVGADNVINQLQAANDIEVPVWATGLFSTLPILAQRTPELNIQAEGSVLTLSGEVDSPETREEIAKTVQDAVGETVTVNNQLQLVASTPLQLQIKLGPDTTELSGRLPQTTLTELEAIVQVLPGNLDNQVLADPGVAAPEWLPGMFNLLPQIAQEVSNAELNVLADSLTLSGNVPSEQQSLSLEASLREAVGSAPNIENQLQVIPLLAAPSLSITNQDDTTRVSGLVPSAVANQLSGSIAQLPNAQVAVEVTESVASAAYLPSLIDAVPGYIETVKDAELKLQDNQLTLQGVVPSDEVRAEVVSRFAQVSDSGVALVDNLTVIPPVAPQLRFTVQDGVSQLQGNLPSSIAETLTGNMTSGSTFTAVENLMVADSNVAVPPWLPNFAKRLPDLLANVRDADVSLTDNSITLAGIVRSEEQKLQIGEQFAEAAEPQVTLLNNLSVVPSTPLALSLTKTADGLRIQGNHEESTGQLSERLASLTHVETQVQAAPDVELPLWLPELLEVLPDLAADIENGTITVDKEKIILSGIVPDEIQRLTLEARLREAVGSLPNIENQLQVEVVVTEDPPAEDSGTSGDSSVAIMTVPTVVVHESLGQESAEETNQETVSANSPAEVPLLDLPATADTLVSAPDRPGEAPAATEVPAATEEPAAEGDGAIPEEPVMEDVMIQQADIETASEFSENVSVTTASDIDTNAEEPVNDEPQPSEADQATTEIPTLMEASAEVPLLDLSATITSPGAAPAEQTVDVSIADMPNSELPATDVPAVVEVDVMTDESVEDAHSMMQEMDTEDLVESQGTTPQNAVEAVGPTQLESGSRTATLFPRVRIDITGPEVRLTGTVPSTDSVTLAAEGFTDQAVFNALQAAEVINAPWLPQLYTVAPQVARDINRATMTLENQVLTLQGAVQNPEQRELIGRYVSDAMQPDITVINRLTVNPLIPYVEDGK